MTRERAWAADPRIPWRILLTATAPDLPTAADLHGAHQALAQAQGWGVTPPPTTATDSTELRRRLATAHAAPVVLGRAGDDLVVSAHHSAVDGLGLLRVLDGLGLGPATSTARGVGYRPTTGGAAAAIARRLREAALTPPAGLGADRPASPGPGDVMVQRPVPGSFRTADLVHAATRAVVAHQSARGRSARHVAIAVGASREPAPGDPTIRDRSALLRLRDVEDLDRAAITAALRDAPLQVPPAPGGSGRGAAAIAHLSGIATGLLAPRLGSTLLVSHLGDVTAPAVTGLAFHPVTAGGTGVSLGAVELGGHTVVSLRARAAAWNDDGLEQLLEAVISLL